MLNEKLQSLDVLVQRILPQVSPCPRTMVIDALQNLASDFCKQTGVWTAELQEDVVAGDSRIIIASAPKTAVLAGLRKLYIGGSEQDKADFVISPRDIELKFTPQQNAVAVIDGTLRPKRDSDLLPESIIEEWGDILSYGALAKLKSMSGANIGWSDMNGASMNIGLYNEGCGRARVRMLRNRLGGGSLSFTSGE